MPNLPDGFSQSSLTSLSENLRAHTWAGAEVCARYVLLHLHRRHPRQWLSGPRPSPVLESSGGLLTVLDGLQVALTVKQIERLKGLGDVRELYQRFYFRGLVLDSHEGLVGWLEERYPLILRLDIPSPDEMLEIQCRGLRYVTLMLAEADQFRAFGRHADACDFMLHDFEHAHKFFGNTHRGQVRFFQALRSTLELFGRWTLDPQFNLDLDYLKSDMNSHPVHLMKYLKAIVLSAEMRLTGTRWPELNTFWDELFSQWQMDVAARGSALKINHPDCETPGDLISVAEFFYATAGNVLRACIDRR